MIRTSRLKSLTSIEVFLVLFFSSIVIITLIYIGNKFSHNIIIYNVFAVALIFFVILVASIMIFQFVKIRFVNEFKREIIADLDNYKNKLENKVTDTNSRIFGFETNYSKMLKKISKEYNTKAKEIENIKRELDIKSIELDRKSAYLEIEFCNMKAEYIIDQMQIIKGKSIFDIDTKISNNDVNLSDKKKVHSLYKKIIELNNKYLGVSNDEFIKNIQSELKKIEIENII